MRITPLLVSLTLGFGVAAGSACEKGRKVTLVKPDPDAGKQQIGKTEEQLRQEYEERIKARENAPEPELDPKEPREKLELVWRMGRKALDGIYQERADMIDKLKRVGLLSKKEKKVLKPLLEELEKFGIGRDPEEMEKAPDELCALITEVRGPAEKLIADGTVELKKIAEKIKELDGKADSGGTVYQKQWDRVEDDRKRWSAPVLAGKQVLLIIRSLLDEAYILADYGARRVQIKLRDCLGKILAGEPLQLDLAQEQLEKVVKRAKWYRELR